MPVPQLISASLERTVNQALKWANNSEQLLTSLVGTSCIIYIQEFQQALIFSFSDNTLEVLADEDQQYTVMPEDLDNNQCWVSVSLFALDKLKQNNQLTKLIKSGQLDFSGNLGILQALSRLFEEIELDFEEILSGYVGDVPAYHFTHSVKKLANYAQQQMTNLADTLSDAALDEKPIGVRKIMVYNFCDEVNALRANVDRLEAKISNLEESLKIGKGPTQS